MFGAGVGGDDVAIVGTSDFGGEVGLELAFQPDRVRLELVDDGRGSGLRRT